MLADYESIKPLFNFHLFFEIAYFQQLFFLDYFGLNQKNQLVFISLYTQLISILFSAFVCGSAAIALYFISNALSMKLTTKWQT